MNPLLENEPIEFPDMRIPFDQSEFYKRHLGKYIFEGSGVTVA